MTAENSKEELLVLETRISAALGELARLKPDDPRYSELDQKLNLLLRRKNQLQE